MAAAARKWDAERLETLAHLRAQGVSWETCALVFGSSAKACERALAKRGQRRPADNAAPAAAPTRRLAAPTSPAGGGGDGEAECQAKAGEVSAPSENASPCAASEDPASRPRDGGATVPATSAEGVTAGRGRHRDMPRPAAETAPADVAAGHRGGGRSVPSGAAGPSAGAQGVRGQAPRPAPRPGPAPGSPRPRGLPPKGPAPATCQWIDGDPTAGADKCGAPSAAGKPFCPAHAARVYRAPTRAERQAVHVR